MTWGGEAEWQPQWAIIGKLMLVSLLVPLAGCTSVRETSVVTTLRDSAATAPALSFEPVASGLVSADQAIRSALLHHPRVQEAASSIAVSAQEIRVAQAALYPQLGLGVSTGVDSDGGVMPALEVRGSQLITDFGVTDLTVDAANIQAQRSYVAFQQAADDVVLETLKLMADVKRFTEVLGVRQAQLARMRELRELMQSRRQAGAISKPDLLETELRIQAAEYELLEAQLAQSEAKSALMRVAGVEVHGPLPNISGSQCISTESPGFEVQIALLERAAAAANLQREERGRYPSISLEGLARQPLDSSPVVGVNLKLGTTLFDGGAQSARMDAAEHQLAALEAAVQRAEQDAALKGARLTRELSATAERASMLGRQIQIVAETRELYLRQYLDLGTRNLIELLDNEEDYFRLQTDRIDVQYDQMALTWSCASSSGTLLSKLNLDRFSLAGYPLRVE